MKLNNVAVSIADKLFFPVNFNYKNIFTTPFKILVIVFFIYSIIIANPYVIEYIKNNTYYIPLMSEILLNNDYWKKWLPYYNLVLEIMFFLLISGSVFSEWLVINSKKTIEKYEKSIEEAKTKEIISIKDNLTLHIKKYNSLFQDITFKNFIQKMYEIHCESRLIINILANDIAKSNAKFLGAKLAVSFPGRLYGLFAFFIFGLLIQFKIGYLYLSHIG